MRTDKRCAVTPSSCTVCKANEWTHAEATVQRKINNSVRNRQARWFNLDQKKRWNNKELIAARINGNIMRSLSLSLSVYICIYIYLLPADACDRSVSLAYPLTCRHHRLQRLQLEPDQELVKILFSNYFPSILEALLLGGTVLGKCDEHIISVLATVTKLLQNTRGTWETSLALVS